MCLFFRYTNHVVTLWYRPPELLLGERNYGPAVDFWSLGCIMAEMWTRGPILRGHTEQEQLKLISAMCGSITPEVWPGVQSLGLYNVIELPRGQKRQVCECKVSWPFASGSVWIIFKSSIVYAYAVSLNVVNQSVELL
jgi:serine/threonine protein kinase